MGLLLRRRHRRCRRWGWLLGRRLWHRWRRPWRLCWRGWRSSSLWRRHRGLLCCCLRRWRRSGLCRRLWSRCCGRRRRTVLRRRVEGRLFPWRRWRRLEVRRRARPRRANRCHVNRRGGYRAGFRWRCRARSRDWLLLERSVLAMLRLPGRSRAERRELDDVVRRAEEGLGVWEDFRVLHPVMDGGRRAVASSEVEDAGMCAPVAGDRDIRHEVAERRHRRRRVRVAK